MPKVLWIGALMAAVAVPSRAQNGASDAHSDAPSPHEKQHQQAAPVEESNVDYFWRKSDEAFHRGDYERAVGLHRAIVALAPDDTRSFGVGAWLLWSMGRGEEAMAFIARGLKANPQSAAMWIEAGEHYNLQKKVPEAFAAYRRAVELGPPGDEAQMTRRQLAHAAERAADLKFSAQTWRDLVRDFPAEVVNQNNLGRVEKLLAAG
jgi:tetratricopeptide (TPR) repeat protein